MVALSGPGWNLAPSLAALVRELDAVFPDRDHTSDGSIGDQAHASRESDHNPYEGWVHAVDLDEDIAPGTTLAPLWQHLIVVRDPRIRYLIYEGRIVKSYRDSAGHAPWKPYPYTGPNAHLHHLHVSITRTAPARDNTHPWGVAAAYSRQDDDMTPEQSKQLAAVDLRTTGILADLQAVVGDVNALDLRAQAADQRLARIEAALARVEKALA